jgi:predicted  nucleic acid-binding Zn-ribbon protein
MKNSNLEKKAGFLMEKITTERNQIDYFRSEVDYAEARIEQLEEDIVDLQNQMDEDPNYDSSLLGIVVSYQEEIHKIYEDIDEYFGNIKKSKSNIKLYMSEYDECVDINFERDFTPIPEFTDDDLLNPNMIKVDINIIN